MFRILAITLLLAALAACQTASNAPSAPTVVPFPTVTPGRLVRGILPLQPIGGDSASLANPATAVALASQPTATPDSAACPAQNPDLTLPPIRPATQDMSNAIAEFLSSGGTASALTSGLRESWFVIGETGFVQSDADLTGEGSPDILVSYITDEGGTLLILGCIDGVYQTRYQAITGGDAPEILWLGDVNVNASPEVIFSNRLCPPDVTPTADDDERCTYRTQLISWQSEPGRFVSLLPRVIEGEDAPTVTDMDDDRILEVVSLITSDGTAETGPQRTGVNIWDWNGSIYTLSIVQRDPPRYRIQVIHEADRVFNTLDIAQSIPLYEVALNDADLREWIDGDDETLGLYIQYKLMLAYAYLEDERFLTTYQTITTAFPDPATRPVYAALADTFWNAMQVTNNLHSACLEVSDIIEQRPEALGRLNSYGSRSPLYTAENLCPF